MSCTVMPYFRQCISLALGGLVFITACQSRSRHANSKSSPANESVSISAELRVSDTEGEVHIKWNGAQSTDLVVITLDSREAMASRSVPLEPSVTNLFGLVLVRSVNDDETAVLHFQQDKLAQYFSDAGLLATAYLVRDLDVLMVSGSPNVKGGERVRAVTNVSHEDCSSDFLLVCPDEDDDRVLSVVPTVGRLLVDKPGGTRCKTSLDNTSIRALATTKRD